MEAPFLLAIGVGLCVLSGMIVVRLAAAGASGPRVAIGVVEVWLALGLWVAVLSSLLSPAGPAAAAAPERLGGGVRAFLADTVSLLAAARPWQKAAIVMSLVLAGHLMWSLGRVGRREG